MVLGKGVEPATILVAAARAGISAVEPSTACIAVFTELAWL